MGITHLEFAGALVPRVMETCAEATALPYVSFAQSSNIMTIAARFSNWPEELGVWIVVDDGYGASMAARDLKTLSWLIRVTGAVIESRNGNSREHAEVVRALLTDDQVDFANSVANLSGAFNRPGPPETIKLWWFDDDSSVSTFDGATLSLVSSRQDSDVVCREFR